MSFRICGNILDEKVNDFTQLVETDTFPDIIKDGQNLCGTDSLDVLLIPRRASTNKTS